MFDSLWFQIVIGIVLVGYMGYIFYQSVKGGISYKKNFENFKNVHKEYETYVDGGYWVWVMLALALVGFVMVFVSGNVTKDPTELYYYRLAYGCIGLVFLGLMIDSYTHRHIYFTEDGFFYEDHYYRYRMVASFEFKNGLLNRSCTVLMNNRDKLSMTSKIGQNCQERYKAFKKAKKGKRK